MSATAELSKEEQELFDSMQQNDGAEAAKAAAEKEAADKAAADQAAKEAADKAAAEKAAAEKAKEAEKKEQDLRPALKEAREQNRELRKELDAMKSVVADGDKKLQKLVDSITNKADAGPKFEDDPAGALKHENEQLKRGLTELQAKIARQEQAGEQNAKVNEHASLVSAREAAFAKEHPDYFKAAEYVAEVWRDEFKEAGFDDAEVPKLVFGKSIGITTKALQSSKDPAEAIYKIAKRYGFAAKQEAPKKEDGESKLKQIEKGLEASKGNGGGTGPDDTTLSSLAQMDDDQIEKLVSDKDWWSKNIRRSPL